MSYNRILITSDLDMRGHSIKNLKPESYDKPPSTDYLEDGFKYFNTRDRQWYQYDKVLNAFKLDSNESEILSTIDILQSEINSLQSEIDTLEEADVNMLDKITNLTDRVSTLEQNYNLLDQRITNLENPV